MKRAGRQSTPFLMCCHFKAAHEPYDYRIRMGISTTASPSPEPKNLLDWGPGSQRPFFSKDRHWKNWNAAGASHHRIPTSGGAATRTAVQHRRDATDSRQTMLPTKSLSVTTSRCGATVDDKHPANSESSGPEMNIADNTIVIYVSDQGYFLEANTASSTNGCFDEESARMPFVIRYPDKVPAGKRLDDLILNVDFRTDAVEFAGVKRWKCARRPASSATWKATHADRLAKKSTIATGPIALFVPHTSPSGQTVYKADLLLCPKSGHDWYYGNFDFTPSWDFLWLAERSARES